MTVTINKSSSLNEKGISYIGRFDFSNIQGPKFGWSGSTIKARFYGSKVTANLRSIEGENYFTVIVDGEIVNNLLIINNNREYVLADGLTKGIHTVMLIKRTELKIGVCQFMGFDFHEGEILEPEYISDRRVEFIGDSISCGFAIEAENENVEYNPKNDNVVMAYDMLATNLLEAECHIIACSGYGVYRNYDGNTLDTMINKYNLITTDTNIIWNNSEWQPQVVVINLCTNDFVGGIPEKNIFVNKYMELINTIHHNYAKAKVICTIGPMIDGIALDIAKDYIENGIVKKLSENSNEWITFFQYETQKKEDGYGGAFHPSVKTHKKMADKLAVYIKEFMNW